MDDDDIIWQVVFCAETIGKGVVRGMYKTLEAAKKRREELVENQIHEDHFDMYPLDREWEYYVRGISVREFMNERKATYNQLMCKAAFTFWDYCDEHFKDCCHRTLEKLRDCNNPELWAHMSWWGRVFTPWQIFHKEARVLAYLHTEIRSFRRVSPKCAL